MEMITPHDPHFLQLFSHAIPHFYMNNSLKKMRSPLIHVNIVPFSELSEQFTCIALNDIYLNNNKNDHLNLLYRLHTCMVSN